MARPSLAAERQRQIVAATVRCMAESGYGGSTLERIAEAAGMARGHIRHYAGNRDALITTAARVFFFGEAAHDEADVRILERQAPLVPHGASLDAALDYLFGEFGEPGVENAATFAFMDAARTQSAVLAIINGAYRSIQTALEQALIQEKPEWSPQLVCDTAYGILSIAMGNTLLNDLQTSPERVAISRRAAMTLVARGHDAPSGAEHNGAPGA